jgi:hypothetical protein
MQLDSIHTGMVTLNRHIRCKINEEYAEEGNLILFIYDVV